jgi:hypothetical protein
MPFVFFVLGAGVRPQRRASILFLAGLLMLLAALPATCALFELTSATTEDRDPGFEPTLRRPLQHGELVLYRTDCGAPCSFGLVLRQERPLMPGLQLARTIWSWSPADSATIDVLPTGRVRVVAAPYGERRPNPIVAEIPLRKWLILP